MSDEFLAQKSHHRNDNIDKLRIIANNCFPDTEQDKAELQKKIDVTKKIFLGEATND